VFLRGISYSLVKTLLLHVYNVATIHFITDRSTERQTDRNADDIIMTIADHTAWQYARLK